MNRRLVLAAIAALVALPAAAPALAAKAPAACPSFTDAKGDSGPAPDAATDITAVTYKTVGKELVATLTVDKLADRPMLAVGNRFQFDFKLAGHDVTLYYKTSPTRDVEANAFYQQGLRVDGTFVNDAVNPSIKGNTVSIGVTFSELKGAAGPVLGKPITAMTASTLLSYVATNEPSDSAEAPATLSLVAGAACK
jgi:hypothetical protein